MSTTGKPGGLLTNLPNPAAKKPAANPVVVSREAEEAFGLVSPTAPAPPEQLPVQRPAAKSEPPPLKRESATPEPERSKTFFLPYSICQRLEMQKLSERREMKHILRQALEEYFERNPLRQLVRDLYSENT